MDINDPKIKKIVLVTLAVVVVLVLILGYLAKRQAGKNTGPESVNKEQGNEMDEKFERQKKEMDELREKSGFKDSTEEEIKGQKGEMDELRKKSGLKNFTQEEIEAQRKEMDELRANLN
jgi:hypothetical protein